LRTAGPGLLLNLDGTSTFAVALTLFGRDAGADVYRHDRRRAGRDGCIAAACCWRVLVLPLSIPVLIFGVAASQAAIIGTNVVGTPFESCAHWSLISL